MAAGSHGIFGTLGAGGTGLHAASSTILQGLTRVREGGQPQGHGSALAESGILAKQHAGSGAGAYNERDGATMSIRPALRTAAPPRKRSRVGAPSLQGSRSRRQQMTARQCHRCPPVAAPPAGPFSLVCSRKPSWYMRGSEGPPGGLPRRHAQAPGCAPWQRARRHRRNSWRRRNWPARRIKHHTSGPDACQGRRAATGTRLCARGERHLGKAACGQSSRRPGGNGRVTDLVWGDIAVGRGLLLRADAVTLRLGRPCVSDCSPTGCRPSPGTCNYRYTLRTAAPPQKRSRVGAPHSPGRRSRRPQMTVRQRHRCPPVVVSHAGRHGQQLAVLARTGSALIGRQHLGGVAASQLQARGV